MNADDYKSICNQPNAFRRDVLEATEQALTLRHPASAMRLRDLLGDMPAEKPHLHEGGEGNDFFIVHFDVAAAEEIMEYLIDAEAESVAEDGTTTSEASRLATLIEAWVRYIDFCDAAS